MVRLCVRVCRAHSGQMSECHRSPRTRGMLGDRGAGRKTLAMVVIFAWNLITLMEFSFVIRLVG